MSKIDIIEACSDFGVSVNGSNLAPSILTKNFKNYDIYKIEKGSFTKELEKNNFKKNLDAVNDFNSRLYEIVKGVVFSNKVPLTLGGDHSIAIASALASIKKYNNMGIIWFDAHGDYNTFDTTVTGNLHGLPLAVITGYERRFLATFHDGNIYSPENTVIVGARDLDEMEIDNLKQAGVTIFSTEDIKNIGAKEVTKKAISIACNNTAGLHISFDLDLIDPSVAPRCFCTCCRWNF